jgi:membrane protease YdiL (CAAX protease family)
VGLVNGVLWDLFHFFYHTSLGSVVAYLALTVPLAFVAQRTRSTWPGIIAHFIGNIGLPIGILLRVLGQPLPG